MVGGAEYAKELDKKFELFFGTSKNTDLFLNKISGRGELNLPPKPVISGCDAHSFEDLEKKLGKTIKDEVETTWIKANKTFEGLKQIIYEPEDRVKIQEHRPEDKKDYLIISEVNFIDDSFLTDKIPLNDNLTVIIGGKSTGKSILLRSIAETIDAMEVKSRLDEVKLPNYKNTIKDFQVSWKDGQYHKKNEENTAHKKIIYIPQSYLNRLVDNEESETSIDAIIKGVLEQEQDIKDIFEVLKKNHRHLEQELGTLVDQLFFKKSDLEELLKNVKSIGDKKGIELEVKKLESEISVLKGSSGMSEEDLRKFERLARDLSALEREYNISEYDLKKLKILMSEKLQLSASELETFTSSLKGRLLEYLSEISIKTNEEWIEKLELEQNKLELDIIEKNKSLKELREEIRPLHDSVMQFSAINEKAEKLQIEVKKLKEIEKVEAKVNTLIFEYEITLRSICESHQNFENSLKTAKTEISQQTSISGDLEFDIDVVSKKKIFQKDFIELICNLKLLTKFNEGLLQDYSEKFNINTDLPKIIKGIIEGELNLKSSFSKKEAVIKLVQNWFIFNYSIKYNGDNIAEMSPGKKSFVLLKLLIELDNSRCPILLDQPEDDLDNRSIYNDLVSFIRLKKKDRQIIIATHNPNLVVGADAECVIVANQSLDLSQNESHQFEYISGALEDSFISKSTPVLLSQGIQEHVCDILEGGRVAFESRRNKYNIV
ncbi:hypothetical protein COB57_03330 [Candidatus Peregrinibacteria bacterium]|nr:MAG: hypothetical protein COB57_03330 [Candidatus Peregrinibacteria bacterium]